MVLDELSELDEAVYGAIARSPTPQLDRVMARLSDAANYSRLSLGAAAALAMTRGDEGREPPSWASRRLAVTAAVVNLAIKPLGHRDRPDRDSAPGADRPTRPDAQIDVAPLWATRPPRSLSRAGSATCCPGRARRCTCSPTSSATPVCTPEFAFRAT